MKIQILIVFLISVLLASAASAQTPKDELAVRTILGNQKSAWNAGDPEKFMKGYWESDSLKFIGKSGITYGWQATLDRYRKSYPTKDSMGILSFDILHVEDLGKKHMMVTGKWMLERQNDTPAGHFLLIWKKIEGNWVIIADHSS